jgi:tRNA(His) guanylyltransferase
MNSDIFESLMREGERYHKLRIPLNAFPVIRVDGRGFSEYTNNYFEKPFDTKFSHIMRETTKALMEKTDAIYGFTESDEISIMLSRQSRFFGRSVEKLVSITAAIAAATFTHISGHIVEFDSRVWFSDGGNNDRVIDYFRWRQGDADRCCLNGHAYWGFRNKGYTKARATKALENKNNEWKIKQLMKMDICYDKLPAWQRNGIGYYKKSVISYIENQYSTTLQEVTRKILTEELDLPTREDYTVFIENILKESDKTNE